MNGEIMRKVWRKIKYWWANLGDINYEVGKIGDIYL